MNGGDPNSSTRVDRGLLAFGRGPVRDEARALDTLADAPGVDFERAVAMILAMPGKLIVSGLGKSGQMGRKIAAIPNGVRPLGGLYFHYCPAAR